MKRLENRVAIVTGGAGGMGAATARRFVDEGAKVVITDLQQQAGLSLASLLGESSAFCLQDVTSRQDWDEVIRFTRDRFGPADILVNNAGLLQYGTIADMDETSFDRLMAINVKGVLLGMQAVIPDMLVKSRGCILNVSSTGAMLPTNGTGAYAASKAAVEAMSRSAALELGPHGIRVNSIHPGGINTPMTNPDQMRLGDVDSLYLDIPMQRAGHPEEVANLSLFLASDEASYCTGTQFVVDGGSLAGKYHAFLPGAPEKLFGEDKT